MLGLRAAFLSFGVGEMELEDCGLCGVEPPSSGEIRYGTQSRFGVMFPNCDNPVAKWQHRITLAIHIGPGNIDKFSTDGVTTAYSAMSFDNHPAATPIGGMYRCPDNPTGTALSN